MVTWLAIQENALFLCIWMASVGVVIWTLEHLSHYRQLKGNGLFSWSLLKYQHRFTIKDTNTAKVFDFLLRYPNILITLTIRVLAALLLVLFVSHPTARLVGICGIYLTNLLFLNLWAPNKRASDGLTEVIFGSLVLLQLGGESYYVVEAGLWFIAAQVCISYCVNGIVKIGQPAWMQGTALLDIAKHPVTGSPSAVRLLQSRPGLTKLLTWGAVVMECLFPLVLVLGWPWCWIFLGWGILFHILCVYWIGLNSFFWSFLATYPAVIYVSLQVQELIS